MFTNDNQDNVEILRQLRLLYVYTTKENNTHDLFLYNRC